MESHPIPQQISSYQFRLVGDMTLKQFFQIGGGALVSLLIYATHIHPVVKWPLIVFSFAVGAALAFLPFEERPLSKWIVSFFGSIYSPTIFTWSKSATPPVYFSTDTQTQTTQTQAPVQPAVNEYLKTLPQAKEPEKLEKEEQGFLQKISDIFTQVAHLPVKTTQPATPADKILPKKENPTAVPGSHPISLTGQGFRPKIVVEEKVMNEVPLVPEVKITPTTPVLKETEINAKEAQFSPGASPPNPPYMPNTVVGQVLDDQGKIVEGAILEIRDTAGRPVRALRSNKVGHFIIVTALPNGQYDIVTEKEGLLFEPVTFEAVGKIIPPILIKAKGKTEVEGMPKYSGKPLVIN